MTTKLRPNWLKVAEIKIPDTKLNEKTEPESFAEKQLLRAEQKVD
jgi:hypothetical protein